VIKRKTPRNGKTQQFEISEQKIIAFVEGRYDDFVNEPVENGMINLSTSLSTPETLQNIHCNIKGYWRWQATIFFMRGMAPLIVSIL